MPKSKLIHKDLHITESLRNRLVEFLVKKTGLEWYYFLKAGDITKELKRYLLDYARCFSDLSVSFDSQKDFDISCRDCFEERGTFRLIFIFKPEEYEVFVNLCNKYNVKTYNHIFFILLTAIINQNKKLSIPLETFTTFFVSKGNRVVLLIPSEIVQKLSNAGFDKEKKKSYFLRKALLYQIYFGKTNDIKDPQYFKVTPQKTNWIKTLFLTNNEITNYIINNSTRKTRHITLLNNINTYLEELNA